MGHSFSALSECNTRGEHSSIDFLSSLWLLCAEGKDISWFTPMLWKDLPDIYLCQSMAHHQSKHPPLTPQTCERINAGCGTSYCHSSLLDVSASMNNNNNSNNNNASLE